MFTREGPEFGPTCLQGSTAFGVARLQEKALSFGVPCLQGEPETSDLSRVIAIIRALKLHVR